MTRRYASILRLGSSLCHRRKVVGVFVFVVVMDDASVGFYFQTVRSASVPVYWIMSCLGSNLRSWDKALQHLSQTTKRRITKITRYEADKGLEYWHLSKQDLDKLVHQWSNNQKWLKAESFFFLFLSSSNRKRNKKEKQGKKEVEFCFLSIAMLTSDDVLHAFDIQQLLSQTTSLDPNNVSVLDLWEYWSW